MNGVFGQGARSNLAGAAQPDGEGKNPDQPCRT